MAHTDDQDAIDRIAAYMTAVDASPDHDDEIIAGPPTHDAPYLSGSDLRAALRTLKQLRDERDASATAAPIDNQDPELWWPFTGGADVCYGNHGSIGDYRECCLRAGLAYALKVHEQRIWVAIADQRDALVARITELEAERDGDMRAVRDVLQAAEGYEEGRALNRLFGRFYGRVMELGAADAEPAAAPTCPTSCDVGCETDCHEEHDVPYKRRHRPEDCPSRAKAAALDGQGGEAATGCLCPCSRMPDGTLIRDGVVAAGCPMHDVAQEDGRG